MQSDNKLLRALRDLDDMDTPLRLNGEIMPVFWVHPYDRDRKRPFDWDSAFRLIALGFLEWTLGDDDDPRYEYLSRTPRGQAIIRLYRGAASRNALDDWRQNYTRWLDRAEFVLTS
jgi:hypothetical protein